MPMKIKNLLTTMALTVMFLIAGKVGWAQKTPTNWTGDTDITLYQETTDPHGGTYCAKIAVNSGTQANCDFTNSTTIPVTAGSTYSFSFWYKTSAHVKGCAVLIWTGASTTYGTYTNASTSTWTQLTHSGTVPTGVTAVKLAVRFYDQTSFVAPETQYIDDMTFESPTGTAQTVTNGDLETWPSYSNITNAFTVGSNALDVLYDGASISATATDYNLTGTAAITFSTATIDGTNANLLHLTGASAPITADLTVDNIADANVNFNFYAGVMPIANTSVTNAGGKISNDVRATFLGIVSANDAYNNVWISDASGAYNGVMIYDNNFDASVSVGDEVRLSATLTQYTGLTELKNPVLVEKTSTGNTPYGSSIITGSVISAATTADTDPAESWEGQLVHIKNAKVTTALDATNFYYTATDDDGATTFRIGDAVIFKLTTINLAVNDPISVIGVVDYEDGAYRINPRTTSDVYDPTATSITSFAVAGQVGSSVIDETNHTVTFVMPSGATLTGLTPTIAVSTAATISPVSGAAQDFVIGTPVDYTVTSENGTTQVYQVTAKTEGVVNISDNTVTYDGTAKTITATTTPADLNLVYTYNGSSTQPINAGTYTVVATIDDATYGGTASATLTINKVELTVTADNKSKTYGDANPSLTGAITGFVNSETESVITGTASYTCAATTTSPAETPVAITTDVSGMSATNYTFTAVNGELTINRAVLTVTADDKSKTYGDANPAFTGVITGYVNSETETVITGSASYTCTADATTPVGSVDIVTDVTGMSADNYSFSAVNGTLTIDKAQLTVTADNKTRVYGAENPTFTSAITGMVNSESVADACSGTPEYTCTAIGTSPVGTPVTITPTIGTLASTNYSFTFVDGELTITKAELTVAADNKTKAYGEVNPTFTGTITGLANSETEAVITGSASYTCTADETTAVGTVDIVTDVTAMSADNYSFTGVNGTLTITKATATVTLGTLTFIYDGNPKPVTATTTPDGLTVDVTYEGINGTVYALSATAPSAIGEYAVVATVNETNYAGSTNGTLTITDKTPATVAITNITATYDGNTHPVTVTTTQTSDGSPISVTVNVTYNGSTTVPTNAGSYAVVATIDDATYVGVGNATLTISKVSLTVTADNKTKTYGDVNPTFTGSISGFVNSEDESVITGTPSYTCTATATTPAGTANIVPNVGTMSATNYSFATVNGTLTIDKAQLTVTADNKTRVYGEANPTLTSAISGMVNSETVATACSGTPAYTCTAIGTSPVGTPVAITPTLGTLTSTNYNFTFVDGELSITKAELTVTADDKTKVYGEANPTLTGTVSGFANSETESVINGNAVYTCAATETTNVGTVDIITDVTGMTANNYTFTGVNSTLTITKATATITISNTEQAYDGTAKPVTVVTDPEGLTVEVTYDGSTTVPVSAGTYAVVATINETNYEGTQSATLTINQPEGDLFISEYIEGSSNNKAIEIYNPKATAVDLSQYALKKGANGADFSNTLALTGTLEAGGVYIVANSGAADSIKNVANYIDAAGTIVYYNGDDAVGLFKNGVLIDVIGLTTGDPGTNWPVAGTGATSEYTLVRKDAINTGTTDWNASAGTDADNSQWVVYPQDRFAFIGWHKVKSSAKDILTFSLAEQTAAATIDATAHTVSVEVISGTAVTALVPTITVSNFATVSPASGVAQDFTNPVTYTVTAQDGSTEAWTVTVTVATALSSEKDITSFAIASQVSSSIDATAATVTVVMPYGTDLTNLTPTIVISSGASIDPASGVAQDFSSPVQYTVTAQDASTKAWTVTVTAQEITLTSIYNIQYTTDATGNSPYLDQKIRTKGIVTAAKTGTSTTSFFLQDGTGPWCGVYVYGSATQVTTGDSVELVATVAEYYNETELKTITNLTIINSGNTAPAPTSVSLAEAGSEAYEGVLVSVSNVECTVAADSYGAWTISDGTSTLLVDDVYYAYTPTVGTHYNITGIVDYTYSAFKMYPRFADDVEVYTPSYTVTFNVTHNSTAMEGVTINVNSQTLTTNASGVATIDLVDGDYNFTATKSGYNDYSGSFTVAGAAKTVDVVMYATDVETNTIASLKAFPNPFSNEIKFSGADITRVTITSIIGQVVMDKTVSGENSIKTQELVRGIYLVKFTNNKGESTLRKLVKE